MFTRCPECETTFRLSASDLRKAQGKVRCGECSAVFNALEYLAEDAEVEAETGKEWPIEPANDALADTVIDAAPKTGVFGAGLTAADDGAGPEAQNEGDSLQADESPFDDQDDDSDEIVRFDEDIPLASNDEQPDDDDAPDDYDDEPGLGELTDDDESDTDDEPVLYIDIDDDQGEGDDEEDEFVVFSEEEDDEPEESAVAKQPEDHGEAAAEDIDEFDDTIWERIPGVGSLASEKGDIEQSGDDRYVTESERSYHHKSDWLAEDSPQASSSEDPEDVLIEDEAEEEPGSDEAYEDAESLEFDAPRDKWSSIFASTAGAKSEEEEEPVSFTAADDEWEGEDDDSADDDEDISTDLVRDYYVTGSDEDDDQGSYRARYPGISNGEFGDDNREESLDDEREKSLDDERDESRDGDPDAPDETDDFDDEVWEISADDEAGTDRPQDREPDDDAVADETAREHDPAAWVSNIERSLETNGRVDAHLRESDAEAPEHEPDEPPAEGYDVQHIILADESEEREQSEQDAAPSWRPESNADDTEQPARATQWFLGSIAMIVLLGLQLVHYNRDTLATNPAWGATVRDVYAGLGMELYPEWSTQDYEIRGSEAVAGESGPDVMDIRAQIAAVGRNPVGLPYLRVILRDRWSNPVAAKNFSPDDYADAESLPAGRLMQPNSTIEAHVSIADPGSGAQGFELELCLPRRHTGLDCSGKPFR